ncbi:MAG TPA: nucleotide exchange factor GrpE [Polyangia bacterium]|jgi:molecular chaperone GrpE (heat shock protein)|nr:nucleotide exchange factor GrpE [Polyangia bacterium]
MLSWLQRWFPRREIASGPPSREPPPWLDELLGLMQKNARTRAWLGLRLDDVEHKLEAGFASLREAIRHSAQAGSAPQAQVWAWDDLLDAMDLLEEAVQTAVSQGDPGMADGLRGVLVRLERFLGQAEFERLGLPGTPPDGKLFRVVGTEHMPELAEGVITRVVRAAVVRGDRVVREGAVLTNRLPPGGRAAPQRLE